MDHIHHDRTYKKSRFQQELEQSVSRKLISSLLLGCLLFCIAIAVVNALNQNARREDHLESVASTFHEVYDNTSAFLLDAGHTELFLSELRKDQDNLRYLISHYNVSALVEIQLILTDSKGNVRFTTFSEGEMNLHRQEFNGIAWTTPASYAGRLHHGLPLPSQQLRIRYDPSALPGWRISGCCGSLSE